MIRTEENYLRKQSFFERLIKVTAPSDVIIGLFVCSFFINILGLVLPIAILVTYNRVIPQTALYTLTLMAIGVFIAIILEAVLRICRNYVSGWSDSRFEHLASSQGYHHILDARINDYEKTSPGAYLDQLSGIQVLKNFFGGQALISMIDLPFVIIYLLFIFFLAGPLVLVPVIMLAVFAYITYSSTLAMRRQLEIRHDANDKRINYIISVLSGIHTIKSMATEIPMLRRYERLQQGSTNANHTIASLASNTSVISTVARQTTIALVIGVGALSVMSHHLTIGGLAACIILAGRTLQPISRAIDVWTRLQDIRLAEEHLNTLDQLPRESSVPLPSFPTIKGEIELKNISFGYKTSAQELFHDVNINIKANEFVGIKGPNLSGKSTLMWLLTGVITPDSGQILIDGKNINEFDPRSVRRQIAYLPQQGFLFNGSILDNITMFRPELNDKARHIADSLGLTDIIQKFPKGFETMVGKYAVEALTPGLKQIICIARGLIEDPKIILFDEANRHLDHDLDSHIRKMLEENKGKTTILLISTRPSLLSLADHHYQIENKQLRKVEA